MPLIHFVLISATLLAGYSRIVDYKHHASDVVVGCFVGIIIGGIVSFKLNFKV